MENSYGLPPGEEPHVSRYIKFIESILLKGRPRKRLVNSGFENHHIYPSKMGGSDDISNRINLTPREHYLAHLMLWKAYGGPMTTSFWFMTHDGFHDFKINARLFERLKLEANERNRETVKKKKENGTYLAPMKGKKLSDVTKKKLSELAKHQYQMQLLGRGLPTIIYSKEKINKAKETVKQKKSLGLLDNMGHHKPHSENTKKKLSEINKNRRWVTDGIHNKVLNKDDLEKFLLDNPSWRKGRTTSTL